MPLPIGRGSLPPAFGGASRQESVRNGLEALAAEGAPDIVLIHDAARPFADAALIARAIEAAAIHGAAAPGVPLADTIKQIDGAGVVVATPDRARLRAVQTPQSFRFDLIMTAHRAAAAGGRDYTDDAMIAEAAGVKVHIFEGDAANFKLTTQQDFARAMEQLKQPAFADLPDIRMGQGYDVHAFGPGDSVWLGGVAVPHTHGLAGHSDADVLSHAITDAILGAIAEGDIGAHFPPSDPQWKGAASSIFLARACELVRARGGVDRQCRRHHHLRSAEDRPAPGADSRKPRGDDGRRPRPRRDQGDDDRAAGIYRPAGRHGGAGDRDGAAAVRV